MRCSWRKALLLVCAIPAGSACRSGPAPLPSRELIRNGGFEEGGDLPEGWRSEGFQGVGQVARWTGEPISGKASLRLEISAPDVVATNDGRRGANPLKVVQVVEPAPVGEVVTVRARARSIDLEGEATILAKVVTPDRRRTLLGRSIAWTGKESAGGAVEKSTSFYVPGGAGALEISVDVLGRGAALVDDVGVAAGPPPSFAPHVNLLQNPGFEQDRASWTTYVGQATASFDVVKDAARTGGAGARISRTQADPENPALVNWGQEVIGPGFKGQEIVMSGWIRARNVNGRAMFGVYLQGFDADGAPGSKWVMFEDQAIRGTTEWKRVSKRIQIKDVEVHSVTVRAMLDGTGTVDVDDVYMGIGGRRSNTMFWVVPVAVAIVLLLMALGRLRRPATA
ncbi:MAG: hypothetical protein U0166_26490 [Acidobacteriota bacterium]